MIKEIKNKYGRLSLISRPFQVKKGSQNRKYVKCQCDCGDISDYEVYSLQSGNTTSCGCFRKEHIAKIKTKHGLHGNKLYYIFNTIKQRCSNPCHISYKYYGAKGIGVEWNKFEDFYQWAIDNNWKSGMTVDRIDASRGYSKDNCRIVTYAENNRNRDCCIFKNEYRRMAIKYLSYKLKWSASKIASKYNCSASAVLNLLNNKTYAPC